MNKRAIVLISSLAVAVVIVVLACSIFAIGNVKVVTTSGLTLSDAQSDEIALASGIKKGGSVFSLKEDAVIANIEKAVPWVKVITIEKRFPSIVAINCTGRVPYIAIAVQSGGYAMLDRELKVISVSDLPQSGCINIGGYMLESAVAGEFVQIDWLSSLISGSESTYFMEDKLAYFIKGFRYVATSEGSDNYLDLTSNTGVHLLIYDSGDIKYVWQAIYAAYISSLKDGIYDVSFGYLYPKVVEGKLVASWSETLPV